MLRMLFVCLDGQCCALCSPPTPPKFVSKCPTLTPAAPWCIIIALHSIDKLNFLSRWLFWISNYIAYICTSEMKIKSKIFLAILPFFLLHGLLGQNPLNHIDPVVVLLDQRPRLCHLDSNYVWGSSHKLGCLHLVHDPLGQGRRFFALLHPGVAKLTTLKHIIHLMK